MKFSPLSPPIFQLSYTDFSLSDLAGRQTLSNTQFNWGGLRTQTETSLSFVVGGVAPVSVEPEDGAECFAVHECGLLPRLDHHQASRLVDPLTGSLGESQGLQQWRNISVPPLPGSR